MKTMEATERRYNTRFRGVPKSAFTFTKAGRKSGTKAVSSSPAKNDLQTDSVFSKLGKKPPKQHNDSPPKNNKETKSEKSEVFSNEKKPPVMVPATSESALSNGVHHSNDVQPKEETASEEPEEVDVETMETDHVETDVSEAPEKCKEASPSPTNEVTVSNVSTNNTTNSKSVWITSKETLSYNNSNVASYNPKTKMFRCVVCQAVGFMSRIGEHYLGTHCNVKVFQCPQCSYCSAWWRCVRNHMSKSHGVSNAPASMWKTQPLLDEIMQLLQNLKYSVDCEDKVVRVAENSGKRYICPKCPYATDRRDLYNRHENIHREEKPFQCYICYKLFNRADHVKKHFCRIHKDYDYDINLIRRLPSKRSRLPVSPFNGLNHSPLHQLDSGNPVPQNQSVNATKNSNASIVQSQLFNCLTGPPTMVKVKSEIECSPIPLRTEKLLKDAKAPPPIFEKNHSNLLNFLTQSNFPPKPPLLELPSTCLDQNVENISGKRLQEGALAAFGYGSINSSLPKEFLCPYCPWRSSDMWALRIHTATHYNNSCILCNFRSTKESDLEVHMWECHRKRPCSKCNFLADSIMMLDAHMEEKHTPSSKHSFSCRHCSQQFEIRSDMEAHCIFIHNQILRECKQNGCDFCSTDPDVLDVHRKEKHVSSPTSTENKSASTRTQCLYCGCDFADPQSLTLHEEIFHENPLQIAGRRPLDPYSCSVCSYVTPKQLMMMEHMRLHTGQTLSCLAGDGCHFHTPYDTVLREHVLQSHCNDDGIVRCPHCGYRCSTRFSFVSHYEEHHHPFCCTLCEEIEHKYFVTNNSASYLDSTIAALFPFAKRVSSEPSQTEKRLSSVKKNYNQIPNVPKGAIVVDTMRRSRKQLQPRKIVQEEQESLTKQVHRSCSSSKGAARPVKNSQNFTSNSNFVSLYMDKMKRNLARMVPLRCRQCGRRSVYFRHKKNFLFHSLWSHRKRHTCDKCIQTFRHQYQVLLHTKREHRACSS